GPGESAGPNPTGRTGDREAPVRQRRQRPEGWGRGRLPARRSAGRGEWRRSLRGRFRKPSHRGRGGGAAAHSTPGQEARARNARSPLPHLSRRGAEGSEALEPTKGPSAGEVDRSRPRNDEPLREAPERDARGKGKEASGTSPEVSREAGGGPRRLPRRRAARASGATAASAGRALRPAGRSRGVRLAEDQRGAAKAIPGGGATDAGEDAAPDEEARGRRRSGRGTSQDAGHPAGVRHEVGGDPDRGAEEGVEEAA